MPPQSQRSPLRQALRRRNMFSKLLKHNGLLGRSTLKIGAELLDRVILSIVKVVRYQWK